MVALCLRRPWWVAFLPLAGIAFAGDLDEEVERAIDKGVAYLRARVEGDPWWNRDAAGDRDGGDDDDDAPRGRGKAKAGKKAGPAKGGVGHIMGRAAIETYALLKSDASADDPLVKQGLDFLAKLEPRQVYDVSLAIMAFDAAWEQRETDLTLLRGVAAGARLNPAVVREFRSRIEALTRWLIDARHQGKGVWNYSTPKTARYDNSNTQFAVLALAVAAKREIPIDRDVWKEIATHFLKEQEEKGPRADPSFTVEPPPGGGSGRTTSERPVEVCSRGWPYVPGNNPSLNMTAAGLSSLLIAREYLSRGAKAPPAELPRINQALWDGLALLARTKLKYEQRQAYYGLYSVEKVGDLGGIDRIGRIDWYRHGAEFLLARQRPDGSWGNENQPSEHQFRFQTSFALLFLDRATDLLLHARPIVQTGKGASGEYRSGFIYVSKLDGEVSVARLFRKLRGAPRPELLSLAELVLAEAQKRRRLADVVGPLIALARSAQSKAVLEFARKGLRLATDEKHDDPAAYESWLASWRAATAIGASRDAARVGELRKLLADTKSRPLKHQIMWALERTTAREAIGDLITELEDADAAYRSRVYQALKFIAGHDIPFNPDGSARDRADAVARWREWHKGRVSEGSAKQP